MPVGLAGVRSHATLIAEAGGKAWIYGPVVHLANGDKVQYCETWDGSINVRHLTVQPSSVSDANVTVAADLAANEYETSAILLGRRT
jgi:hypothetical protein